MFMHNIMIILGIGCIVGLGFFAFLMIYEDHKTKMEKHSKEMEVFQGILDELHKYD